MRSCGASSSSRRRRHAEHERQVGDLEPALREDRRERRLRGARHADEDEVGLLEVARLLAVVALHGELDRLDAAEVLVREREHALGMLMGSRSRKCPSLPMSEPMTSTASILSSEVDGVDVLAELGAHDGEDDERAFACSTARGSARAISLVRTRVCRRI